MGTLHAYCRHAILRTSLVQTRWVFGRTKRASRRSSR